MKKTLALILSLLMVVSAMAVVASAAPTNFAPLNTSPALSDPDARFDMTSGSLGCRFITQGSAKIKGMSIYTASWDIGTFDFKVYKWEYNYAYSVAQEPVAAVTGISGIASGWLDITFPSPIDHGEYVAVMDNFGGKLVCNYRFTDNEYTDVYLNGEKQACSLQWTVEFTEKSGGWYKKVELSAEVDAPAPAPVEKTVNAFSVLNKKIDSLRFDGNVQYEKANEIALRFATSEVLTAIYPYMAGSALKVDGGEDPSTMDVKVYKWKNNYADTVSGTPVVTNEDAVFGGTGWTKWNKSILPENTELAAGEYLVVINDMQAAWAICNYFNAPVEGAAKAVKTYVNGEHKLLDDGSYATLAWKLVFSGANDGLVKADLSADTTPPTEDTNAPAPDTGVDTEQGGAADTADGAIMISLGVAAVAFATVCVLENKKRKH